MSALQWALLVVGAVAVIAIYITSRRGEKLPKDWAPPGSGGGNGRAPKLPAADQMDMFESKREGEFDEFGVGKPRKRIEPLFGMPATDTDGMSADEPAPALEEKIVHLLIAERDGAAIAGAKVHEALVAQDLQFGDRKIYHRLAGGLPVFSVASLIKPGTLDPAEQNQLATPGLTLFMVLPNGTQPQSALRDMVATTRALAAALNAEVFDAERQVFTAEAEQALSADVDAWAQRNGL
ncbi:cell division protein ZipA C-terminal FtsZ-binding domain-containing protein [Solimonas marina]|uniref:Cell division protein ZipA n=1 Tax=Solimonas marina TaxID=2714601 RepID=A0A969WAX6_9GAMM|nr:cell division protein ZipA C-terminal FtsZ-binding domain-containing protein [Solimonas marina]NKF22653.1 hypothetical protein [Solimonas marina]